MRGEDGPKGGRHTPARRLPEVSSAVVVEAFDDAFVVLDPRVNKVHHLTGLAAVVFDACASRAGFDELVGDFETVVDESDRSTADPGMRTAGHAAAIGEVLDELWVLGLLGDAEPVVEPPCLGCDDLGDPMAAFPRRSWRGYFRSHNVCG